MKEYPGLFEHFTGFNTEDSSTDKLSQIEALKVLFSNDQELGYEVRKLINQWKDEDVGGSFK